MAENEQTEPKSRFQEALAFTLAMWFLSRLVVLVAMLLIAPMLPTPSAGETTTAGWEVFGRWDGEHYQHIVTHGYQFKDNGKGYNVAFFPLFPLLIWAAVSLGLPVELAGTLINNLAFLGALLMLYSWVAERHGRHAARWATAALAWCPFSLFGSVIYTEGLFLLCSTAALRAFDKQQHAWAAVWGALTTALRPPGIALIPTFLVVAWREKRKMPAYWAALLTSTGLVSYMLYCWLKFGQPLAFVLAQRGWQSRQDFYGQAWIKLFSLVLLGPANHKGHIVDPWYPLAILLVGTIALLLWRSRHKFGFPQTGYGFCVLVILLWLVGGAPLIEIVMVFGGAYLLWRFRHGLSRVAIAYGLFSWLIILSTSRTTSAERYAYGVVSLAIAFGLLLSRCPRWGYVTLIFFAVLLGSYSVRFAQALWAG